jgi:hypothetical protein
LNGDTLTLGFEAPRLPSGKIEVSHTVATGNTFNSIASSLATSINGNSTLTANGVRAIVTNRTIRIKTNIASPMDVSGRVTRTDSSAAQMTVAVTPNRNFNRLAVIGGSTTGAGTETVTITVNDKSLSSPRNVTYAVQASNTLQDIATALAAAITADSVLQTIGVTAVSESTFVIISSASPNLTTYSSSTSSGAPETVALIENSTGQKYLLIGGSASTGDVITLTTYDTGLSGGKYTLTYTVPSSSTLESIASGLASAINSDSTLSAFGVSATATSNIITINPIWHNSSSFLSYVNSGATETLTMRTSTNVPLNLSIGGTATVSDDVSISVIDEALSGGSRTVTYSVNAGDDLSDIASGIAGAINSDAQPKTAGVFARACIWDMSELCPTLA